mgnify:FL=1
MPALLALLLPALVPVFTDAIRGVIGWFTGGSGAQPQNVEEAIKLMQAEVEKLKALALLDAPAGNISRWVADLRASFRYIAAGLILMATVAAIFAKGAGVPLDTGLVDAMLQLSGSVFSFMFGDRLYFHLKQK